MPRELIPPPEPPDGNPINIFCSGHTENHEADLCEFRHEWKRRISLNAFPSLLGDLRWSLAENGFYYSGEGDVVQCYKCHLKLWRWPVTNYNIELSHKVFSRNCPLVANVQIPYAIRANPVNGFIDQPGVLSRNEDGIATFLQLAAPFSLPPSPNPPNEDPDEAEPDLPCMICRTSEAVNLLQPCCHLGLCEECRDEYVIRRPPPLTCPACRQQVDDIITVNFISRTCMRCNNRPSEICNLVCKHVSMCQECFFETRHCFTCHEPSRSQYRVFLCV